MLKKPHKKKKILGPIQMVLSNLAMNTCLCTAADAPESQEKCVPWREDNPVLQNVLPIIIINCHKTGI